MHALQWEVSSYSVLIKCNFSMKTVYPKYVNKVEIARQYSYYCEPTSYIVGHGMPFRSRRSVAASQSIIQYIISRKYLGRVRIHALQWDISSNLVLIQYDISMKSVCPNWV